MSTFEKSADELEMASQLQQHFNDAGVAAAAEALKPQTPKGADGKHLVFTKCVDCEDDLPPIRVVMKRIRCTCCQIEEDARLKRGGR